MLFCEILQKKSAKWAIYRQQKLSYADLTLDLPTLYYIYQYYTRFTDRHATTRISDRRNKISESRTRKKNLAKPHMLTITLNPNPKGIPNLVTGM